MSWISQNVRPKDQIEKIKRKASKKPSLLEDDEELEERKEEPDKYKTRKRKEERMEEDKQLEIKQENEMKKLENFLFGSLYSPVEFGKQDDEESSALFFTDRSANSVLSVYENNAEFSESTDDEGVRQRKPVWVDEQEEKIKWAQLDLQSRTYSSDDGDSNIENGPAGPALARGYKDIEGIDDILRTNEDLVVKSSAKLLPGLLEYSRLVNANAEDPSSGPINSIDRKRNKIQSIFLEDCPVRKASFVPDGSQVIAAGRRKFFYSFDLVKAEVDKIGPLTGREERSLEVFEVSPDSKTIAFVGNEGYILLVSSKTKQLIGTLKMNGTVRSLAFANNGRHLLSYGGDGHAYHWDLGTRACFHKAIDEGCINGSALYTSLNGDLFAAGSDNGIVNIYNIEEFLGGKRKRIKTIKNLTTKVDFMKFNNDAQILAISSTMKKNSPKLFHVPSFTVFSNWPPPNQTLHYLRCLDFSPGGGFMAVGNAAGK
ncbi:hypothetical protein U1Q18_040016, partial [Sarracenia purpurea var. burkii]